VQPRVRIILPTFNKSSYLKIILRIMNEKTSMILTVTIATIVTLAMTTVVVPSTVLAGSASGGRAGTGGDAGNGGIGGVGGIAIFGFANGGDANGGHGGDANGGYAQCHGGCFDYGVPKK
jgi:phosphotransferase system  glucose/maltose/N-acetylglucosamine-specific IIC component